MRDRSVFHSCHSSASRSAAGHPAACAIEWVKVIADRPGEIPDAFKVGVRGQRIFAQLPAEQARRIGAVILRIAAAGQVAKTPRRAFSAQAGVGPLQTRAGSCPRRSHPRPRSMSPEEALRPLRGRARSIPKACLALVIPLPGLMVRSLSTNRIAVTENSIVVHPLGLPQERSARLSRTRREDHGLSYADLSHRTVNVHRIGRSVAKKDRDEPRAANIGVIIVTDQ